MEIDETVELQADTGQHGQHVVATGRR